MNESGLLALTGIGAAALACQWLAWRIKLPAILFLLITGILLGPLSGWLNPNQLFGELLFPIISLSVAIILFEGSLTLKLDEIRGLESVVRNLITIGLLSTWLIITVSTHWIVGLSWGLSFLFGALVVVTGPTVIVPMLRTVRPNATISNILRWEGIMIDPIGALLAVLVFFIVSGADASHIVFIVATGGLAGALGGYSLGLILRHHLLPEYLHNMATLTWVLCIFTVSNLSAEESGLLAVTIMGMWLANMKQVHTEDILHFKEHLSVLLISGLFIILAARIELNQIATLGWSALGVLIAIQFIARPIKVLISTTGSTLSWQERALIGWIAPRGIVAAAVSALFAIRLEEHGFAEAQLIVPLTFTVIIGTVVLQSMTARYVAEKLEVAEPETNGILFVGAHPFARELALTLNRLDFKTLLADTNWDNISAARMAGLSTYYGNLVSEHADQKLDLVGLGRLLALSPQPELNALASIRYRGEFGRNAVYSLPVSSQDKTEKKQVATRHKGITLFNKSATYAKLANLIGHKAKIRVTQLSDDFDFSDFLQQYGKATLPLLALDAKKQNLLVFTEEEPLEPQSGWSIISLTEDDTPTDQTD